MHAPQSLEIGVIHGLHTKRNPIHTRRAITAKTFGLDAGRIGFERHLRIRRHRPRLPDRIEQGRNRLWRHQRRRAATEEDARDHTLRREVAHMCDLAPEPGDITRLIDRRMPDMAVEITVGALRRAEGPVQIDAEAGVTGRMLDHADGLLESRDFGNMPVARHAARAVPWRLRR